MVQGATAQTGEWVIEDQNTVTYNEGALVTYKSQAKHVPTIKDNYVYPQAITKAIKAESGDFQENLVVSSIGIPAKVQTSKMVQTVSMGLHDATFGVLEVDLFYGAETDQYNSVPRNVKITIDPVKGFSLLADSYILLPVVSGRPNTNLGLTARYGVRQMLRDIRKVLTFRIVIECSYPYPDPTTWWAHTFNISCRLSTSYMLLESKGGSVVASAQAREPAQIQAELDGFTIL